MATKTISIDLEAYERLRSARRSPNESFSRVIKRAHWREEAPTAAAFLDALADLPVAGDDVLARLDEAQHADIPPEDRWRFGGVWTRRFSSICTGNGPWAMPTVPNTECSNARRMPVSCDDAMGESPKGSGKPSIQLS
ncbi:antitoxin VapB family protein [Mycobacterium canetti]|uniref:antitoxin VapB family protein n=1 Tax=Mycobacterium canetti TaxID=78331 RepID=UPI0002A59316|nr:antitoxin VapB family protein [Mycobacterium canetti]CCK59353.1 Conserved protein of unknown function [Mycobacterium canettii CIPT 140070010]